MKNMKGYGYSTRPLTLQGSGLTISSNGSYQLVPQMGSGGTPYGLVSSEFGQVAFGRVRGKGIEEDVKKFIRKGLAEDKPDTFETIKRGVSKAGQYLSAQNKKLKESKTLSTVARNLLGKEAGNLVEALGYGKRAQLRGDGFLEDADKFLKESKILSTVGNVLLPAAGGSLAGLFTANPLGAAAGAAAGTAGAEWLKAQGYGKKKRTTRKRKAKK